MWWKHLKKDNREKQEKLQQELKNEGGLEKKDMPAMILAALGVILPVVLLVLALLALLILLPLWLA